MKSYKGATVLNKGRIENPMLTDYHNEMERLSKLPPKVLRNIILKIRGEKL